MVLDAQICQVCTQVVYKYMLFILLTMPVVDFKLVRDSVVEET